MLDYPIHIIFLSGLNCKLASESNNNTSFTITGKHRCILYGFTIVTPTNHVHNSRGVESGGGKEGRRPPNMKSGGGGESMFSPPQ